MEDVLPNELLEEYRQAFQILDIRNVKKISITDLSTITCSIGIQLTEAELRLYVKQITGLEIERKDVVKSIIDFKNFLFLMAVILTECISGEEVLRIFREFDSDGDGFISPDELKTLLARYGYEASDEELKEMMEEADRDGDGKVSLHEFISVMSTSSLMHTRILQNLHPQESVKIDQSPSTSKFHKEFTTQENESSEDSCDCNKTDDDTDLVHHPIKKRRRKKSVVDWLKIKSKTLKANYQTSTTPNNSNTNNNNNDKQSAKKSTKTNSNKRRRNSLTQKLSNSLGMMKKQILKSSKLKVISDEESD